MIAPLWQGDRTMRTGFRRVPTATLLVGLTLSFIAPLHSNAAPPGELPDAAPPFGLPASAPPFGTGIGKGVGRGKGKGSAVAAVSYHCLGLSRQLQDQDSPYSYLADSIVMDAGGHEATLEGAATSDLVADGAVAMVPTHMAAARISTGGLSLQSFDTCGASATSVLNSVVTGIDEASPDSYGAAHVEFRFNIFGLKLEIEEKQGSGGMFSAFAETTLNVFGLKPESFTVSASGELVEAPPGLSITDLSHGDRQLYEISGTHVVPGTLFYGPGVRNIVQTTFAATGEVSGVDVQGSRIVAGFASAEAVNSVAYEIVSMDPNVSFSFAPAE